MCLATTGKIIAILDEAQGLVLAEFDESTREVSIAMLRAQGETIETGDWVHVHLGFVLEKIDADHAAEALEFQRSLDAGVFPEPV